MKIRLIHPIDGPHGLFRPGQMPDLPEHIARQLIRDGHAVKIEPPAQLAAQPAPKQARRK